jgi:hypothetical protein
MNNILFRNGFNSQKTTYSKKRDQTPSEYLYMRDKRKKLKLIDKFIQASPKISPIKHGCLHHYF